MESIAYNCNYKGITITIEKKGSHHLNALCTHKKDIDIKNSISHQNTRIDNNFYGMSQNRKISRER